MFIHIICPKWYGLEFKLWHWRNIWWPILMGQNWYIKKQINKLLRQNAKFHLWHARCRILTFWDNRYILSISTVYSVHKGCIPVNLRWSRSNHLIQSDKLYYILHIRIMVSVSRSRNTLEYLFKPTESFKSPYKTIKTFKILLPCNHAISSWTKTKTIIFCSILPWEYHLSAV